MSIYDDEIEADADEILSELGKVVTYTPATGSPSTPTVVWDPGQVEGVAEDDGRVYAGTGTVKLALADCSSPSPDDSFTIDSVAYGVSSYLISDLFVTFQVVRRAQRRVGGDKSFIRR